MIFALRLLTPLLLLGGGTPTATPAATPASSTLSPLARFIFDNFEQGLTEIGLEPQAEYQEAGDLPFEHYIDLSNDSEDNANADDYGVTPAAANREQTEQEEVDLLEEDLPIDEARILRNEVEPLDWTSGMSAGPLMSTATRLLPVPSNWVAQMFVAACEQAEGAPPHEHTQKE